MEFAATRKGVMIFAATVEHAKEIVGLLPAEDAALITGDTPGAERDVLIDDFKAQRFRYLVNVAVLTTGFDAPHVDLIAILRPYRIGESLPTNCRARPAPGPRQD